MVPLIALKIEVSRSAAKRLERKSLWVFSNEIVSKSGAGPGTWCWFSCEGRVLGTGYMNPHSLIFGRLLSPLEETNLEALLTRRLREAFKKRLDGESAKAKRLVFSESDFLPGLILDSYGGVLVLQSNTAGVDSILPWLALNIPILYAEVFGQAPMSFVIRKDSNIRVLEGLSSSADIVSGLESSLRAGVVEEGGVRYAADFLGGQKTGFFLDQKANRHFLERYCTANKPKSVLDLCAYSGGWGLRALKAGVASVTFVDQSKEALSLINRGLELNGIEKSRAILVPSDVFDFLERSNDSFDVIVSDPPAFAKTKKVLPQAMKAYEKLNRLAWRRLKSEGLLLTCSCSYHLSPSDFEGVVRMGLSKDPGSATVAYQGGQANDHPILLSMPETKYLKCLGIKKWLSAPVVQECLGN